MGLQAHTKNNCSEATRKPVREDENSEQAVLKSGRIKAQEDQAKLAIQ